MITELVMILLIPLDVRDRFARFNTTQTAMYHIASKYKILACCCQSEGSFWQHLCPVTFSEKAQLRLSIITPLVSLVWAVAGPFLRRDKTDNGNILETERGASEGVSVGHKAWNPAFIEHPCASQQCVTFLPYAWIYRHFIMQFTELLLLLIKFL